MAETVLIKIQVEETESKDNSQLSKSKDKGKSLAAGAIGGIGASKIASGTFLGATAEEARSFLDGDTRARQATPGGRKLSRKLAASNFLQYRSRDDAGQFVKNLPNPVEAAKMTAKAVSTAAKYAAPYAAGAAAAYTLYSNYKKTGLELSGATHAAALQQRKTDLANTGVQLGVAIAINPILAAPVLAMKAWELAETNRRELYEMRKSQLTSEILQRNLVKNVAERRF